MQLPPFFYSLTFWEALAWILAGVLGLLAFFGVIPPQFAVGAAAVFAAIKAVLKFFGINAELRSRGLM